MRRSLLLALWIAFIAAPALAAPCTTATPACTEWITPGTAPVRLLVYRSFPLDAKNADITRAVVLVHGAGRDADNYFLHILAAAFLSGALDNTVVLSPRFASTNNGCSTAAHSQPSTTPAPARAESFPWLQQELTRLSGRSPGLLTSCEARSKSSLLISWSPVIS